MNSQLHAVHLAGSRLAGAISLVIFLSALMALAPRTASACPFCAVESQTLTEEIGGADVAVLARLIKEAPTTEVPIDGLGSEGVLTGNATFEIVDVLRGADDLAGVREIEVVFFGEPNRDQLFLITGISAEQVDWTTPLPLSEVAVAYVRQLQDLAPSGADRLAFFQDYFEHEDPLLAQDSYDEFARASYDDVKDLGPRMHHDKLIEWIQDPEVSPSRRRLYFTMLGVCGSERDLPLLEEMITSNYASKQPFVESLVFSGLTVGGPVGLPTWIELIKQDERRKKLGLDSLVACYLVLRGADGLDLIDAELLKNSDAEYTHVYSTIMALRFHGDEADVIPRDRLLASMRLLLDNPDFADQVIIDLSRWEDWSVLDRLVSMFKSSDDKGYVRQPIVTYLTVASEQEGDVGPRAASALEDLEQFDPDSVKRAKSLMAFGFLGRARADGDDSNAARPVAATSALDSVEVEQTDIATSEGPVTSAADISGGDADISDMPDPASFGRNVGTAPFEESESADEVPEAIDEDKPLGTAQTPSPGATTTLAGETSGSSDSKAASSKTLVAQPVAAEAIVDEETPNTLLIIGLPLGAALLLMALYWWILRSGTV